MKLLQLFSIWRMIPLCPFAGEPLREVFPSLRKESGRGGAQGRVEYGSNGGKMRTLRFRRLPEGLEPLAAWPVVRLLPVLGLLVATAQAQGILKGPDGGRPTIIGTDLAVLESKEVRKDLPCEVSPSKPVLGFDLKFHAGFEISVPLRELAGSENLLTILMRVTPVGGPDNPIYLVQKTKVPPLPEDAKGDAYLQGTFDLGEGNYKVDWLMRDRSERVCAHFWDAEATLAPKDKQVTVNLRPGEIAATDVEQFADEPPVQRNVSSTPLGVKVLINFAPQNSHAATLQPLDTSALVSILRCIARDPRISRFSLVAFNLKEQKILYRQESADRIDFPAIGDALRGLQLGKVDFTRLNQKGGDTEFLADLLVKEVAAPNTEQPDAVIFAGPKAMLDENLSVDVLRKVGDPDYPIFYMNYNLFPQSTPWKDSISAAVKHFKGQEFTISRPRDVWFAVTEMMSKIVRFKSARRSAAAALD